MSPRHATPFPYTSLVRSHARHCRPGLQATYGRPTMPKTPSLRDLEHHEAFVERHIGPNDAEIAQMLRVVGHDSLDAMTDAIVPGSIRSKDALRSEEHTSELQSLMRISYAVFCLKKKHQTNR